METEKEMMFELKVTKDLLAKRRAERGAERDASGQRRLQNEQYNEVRPIWWMKRLQMLIVLQKKPQSISTCLQQCCCFDKMLLN